MKILHDVRQYIWVIMAVFAWLCYGHIFTTLAFADEKNIYLAVEDFVWKEFNDDNSQLLKESGTLIGVGFTYRKEFADHMTLQPTAEIFGGSVDYDGQACDISTGVCQPATTKVDYFGLKLQGDVGRKFDGARGRYVEPFGGLGLRVWDRNINNGTAADGSATAGYLERWVTLQARLGVRGGMDISDRVQLFAEAGVKLPLYNENTAYQSSAGIGPDVTINPGKQSSFFAELGMKITRFKGSLFYDGLRFSRSDNVAVSGGFVFQPRSTADIVGLKLGVVF